MIIICGPTSSGKTSLAIKLAKKYDFEIISADSRQIYKYMNYGTGKMPISMFDSDYEIHQNYWIINGVKVWMYDVVTPGEYFSVADFKKRTEEIIGKNEKEKIIVGGTGLYIESLINKNFETAIMPNIELRNELNHKLVVELQSLLSDEELRSLNESDIKNPKRLIRLIEKNNDEVDSVMSDKSNNKFELIENVNLIYLLSTNEFLYEKVDNWVDTIFDKTVEETDMLIRKGYKETDQLKGIIYKTIIDYIGGISSYEDSIQRIKYDLHGYIRRQKTWFNKYSFAEKFDISNKTFDINVFNKVESIYENG